jgi:hypothetical protein
VDDEPVDVFGSKLGAMSPYFKSIPSDIRVGGEGLRLMFAVVVLAILNAVSLAFLVKTLMGR